MTSPTDTLLQLQALASANASPSSEPAAHLFNLASSLAANSLLALNQQQLAQLLSSKVVGMSTDALQNLLTPNNVDIATAAATLQSSVLLQQYATLLRTAPQLNLGELTATLKKTLDTVAGLERKRSAPPEAEDMDVAKRFKEDPEMRQKFENSLDKILKEELFIDEFDLKEIDSDTSPSLLTETDEDSKSGTGSPPVPLFEELSLFDILALDLDQHQAPVSAFRKVSRTEPGPRASPTDLLSWGTAITPPDGSPRNDFDPLPVTEETLDMIGDVARAMNEGAECVYGDDMPLSRMEQIQRLPCVWRGELMMKAVEASVQMNLISGRREFLANCFGPMVGAQYPKTPTMRIQQRMRWEPAHLNAIFKRMETSGASCICIPVGNTFDEASKNNQILKTNFVEYFSSKQAAGISVIAPTESTPSTQVFIFPPCELTERFLSEIPNKQIHKRLQQTDTGYMFVVIVPQEIPEASTSAASAPAVVPGAPAPPQQ